MFNHRYMDRFYLRRFSLSTFFLSIFAFLHQDKLSSTKKVKERTIAQVIAAVSLWRLLYTGFHKNGVFIKMSLNDAAEKVKISKKSLDDYLM